ncbi:MAG: host attachment protein [Chromatiales bacterium]|nr:MAG: host attachment protein [Chromatiales bacterium]
MAGNSEWVLTANGAGYRLFAHDKKLAPLSEVRHVDWPSGRLPARDINSDRPGRSFDSGGQGRHAMEPRTNAHDEEESRLARDIAATLSVAQREGDYNSLIIVAAPRLLGRLREVLPAAVRQRVVVEIDKDLTAYDAGQLTDWLRKEVWEK